ncbi:serine/threonine-protein phosphatase 6 regulatory ankyrin repeat subunit B-like [Mercenaria mercenaria]|uniref:serine/threonine-protein phosphatase 6 regulatory ankyrin repeat subunit B-like n=1 Tax=Mercenaria mercenaria TaxID=6596 RepID=UPI00234F9EF4|nr:serine/threonine-protein phosphatase 6 regulatory ankyrin repeat subunit B-like [Mercenaria mercenaria]
MADSVIIYERCPKQRRFLEAAVKSNDYALVREIIANGADINYQNENGDTVLHIAVTEDDNSNIVKALIAAGIDVNIQNFNGKTPLHLVVNEHDDTSSDEDSSSVRNDSSNDEEHEFDIEDNADTDLHPRIDSDCELLRERTNEEATSQNMAPELSPDNTDTDADIHSIDQQVSNISQEKQVTDACFIANTIPDTVTGNGNSSKQDCLKQQNNNNNIQTLIRAGSDVNIPDMYGNTVLHLALMRSDVEEISKSLVKVGVKKSHIDDDELHFIALQFYNDTDVQTIVDAGADMNKQNIDGKTPIHFAAKSKNERLIQRFLKADADPNIQDEDGNTALHYAFTKGCCAKSVLSLINAGVDVNKQNANGNTALHLAGLSVESENIEIIELLVHAGADVNKQNNKGDTPLHIAISSVPEDENIQALINLGADINKQNADGNTPLHMAILNQYTSFGALKFLLEGSSAVFTKNNDGYDPIQLINSFRTFLRLLKMQRYFNYRDDYGNTLMHVLMMQWSYKDEWKYLLEQMTKLNLDFNAQNNNGQTPLHIIASGGTAYDDLAFILDNFENINLLIVDNNGKTFFHTFIEKLIYVPPAETTNFIMSFLEGRYKNCSAETVKELLRIQNGFGKTPLITYIECFEIRMELFERFVTAGADMTCCTKSGDTVLHYLAAGSTRDDIMKLAISHGANVNAQNNYGDSPIYLVENDISKVNDLLNCGADLKIRNKFGQTPLLVQVLRSQSEIGLIIEMFLANGADVNETDVHGSNLLHYAAWCDTDTKVIEQLRSAGIKCIPDKVGQLPCHVAEQRGNKKMLDEICICGNATHGLCFSQEFIDFENKGQLTIPCKTSLRLKQRLFQRNAIDNLLNCPYLGLVKFEGESREVKETVIEIIRHICTLIGEEDDLLCNTVFQSGSVGENTKIGFPDEFDFVCLISKFPKICEIDEELSMRDANYAYLKLKKDCKRYKTRSLFNSDCFLEPGKVSKRFRIALTNVLQHPSLFRNPNISFAEYKQRSSLRSPNCQFTLRWTGAVYKDMTIDIDLVPACQIKNWWPLGSRLNSLSCDQKPIQNDGALILFRGNVDHPSGLKARVSALNAEKAHMAALPQKARDAYVISKVMFDSRICPEVFGEGTMSESNAAKISSYILKNCMFHVFEESKELKEHGVSVPPTDLLHDYACKIIRKLIAFASNGNLPSFVFPWQNIFSFQSQLLDPRDETHKECARKVVYCKLVLDILGEQDCYSDLFEDVLREFTVSRDIYTRNLQELDPNSLEQMIS